MRSLGLRIVPVHPLSDLGPGGAYIRPPRDLCGLRAAGSAPLSEAPPTVHAVQTRRSPRSCLPRRHPYFLNLNRTKSAPVRTLVPRPGGACRSASLVLFVCLFVCLFEGSRFKWGGKPKGEKFVFSNIPSVTCVRWRRTRAGHLPAPPRPN